MLLNSVIQYDNDAYSLIDNIMLNYFSDSIKSVHGDHSYSVHNMDNNAANAHSDTECSSSGSETEELLDQTSSSTETAISTDDYHDDENFFHHGESEIQVKDAEVSTDSINTLDKDSDRLDALTTFEGTVINLLKCFSLQWQILAM